MYVRDALVLGCSATTVSSAGALRALQTGTGLHTTGSYVHPVGSCMLSQVAQCSLLICKRSQRAGGWFSPTSFVPSMYAEKGIGGSGALKDGGCKPSSSTASTRFPGCRKCRYHSYLRSLKSSGSSLRHGARFT